MVKQNTAAGQNAQAPAAKTAGNRPQQQIVKTWAFDSVGNRKYALQIKRASNGNPCLKVVEGVPQPDGTFRRFELTFWSEDFPRLFETLDSVRAYMAEHNIRTPDGHKFDPNKRSKWRGRTDSSGSSRSSGSRASGSPRSSGSSPAASARVQRSPQPA